MREKIRLNHIILLILFLFVFGFRLYYTFQYDNFNTDEAYFHLRRIDYFLENQKLLYFDELSYGGRLIFYPPLFHIIMALISFGSIFILKLIPELLFSSLVFIIYKIAKEISGSEYSAIFAAAISSFIPILFTETLNNLSVYSFVIPLLFLMFYSLLNLENKKYFWCFIISSFLLPLIHPSAWIFIITIIIYFFLMAGGALNPTKIKKEAVIFSVLLIILLEFIIYKKAFLAYGANILRENIPSNILADSFRQFSPVDLLFNIGLVPLVFGSIGIYVALIRDKRKIAYIFGAFAIAVLLLLVLRLITISIGLMFLGLALSIFTASSITILYNYFTKFKFNYFKHFFVIILLVLFFSLSFSSSITAAKNSAKIDSIKIDEIKWLVHNTKNDAVVLANFDEGNLIGSIANRKTVADSNFLFAPNPIERTKDIEIIYTTVSDAIALNLLHKYNVSVIYFSDDTRRAYGIYELAYAERSFDKNQLIEGSKCFDSSKRGTYYVLKC